MKRTITPNMPKKTRRRYEYKAAVSENLYKLGFKKAYIKYLIGLFPETIWVSYNKNASLSVHHVINDLVKTIDTDIDIVLQNMRAKYKKLYTSITNDIRDQYSTVHLVQIIIEYANGKFDPISTKAFLYNPDIENRWFRNVNQVLCYNAVKEEDVIGATKSLGIEPKYRLYYHATNWNNVKSILDDGPIHKEGRRCLDFGISKSFYVTPNIKTAIEWTRRTHFNFEGGIVVFALNIRNLQNITSFQSPNIKWKTLVKNSRMCQNDDNELDFYDFVYGPMLKNTFDIKMPNVEAKAHWPLKWQLASKNIDSDKILKDAMIGAIFMKRPRIGGKLKSI